MISNAILCLTDLLVALFFAHILSLSLNSKILMFKSITDIVKKNHFLYQVNHIFLNLKRCLLKNKIGNIKFWSLIKIDFQEFMKLNVLILLFCFFFKKNGFFYILI